MADTNVQNRFAQRAKLLNETTDNQARRLAAAVDQPPANAQDMAKDPQKLTAAWNFTPSQQPASDFWALHDHVLQQNMSQLGTDAPPEAIVSAHNDAETQALNAVYPYRSDLVGIGSRVLEDQVAQSDRISRIVQGRTQDTTPGLLPQSSGGVTGGA